MTLLAVDLPAGKLAAIAIIAALFLTCVIIAARRRRTAAARRSIDLHSHDRPDAAQPNREEPMTRKQALDLIDSYGGMQAAMRATRHGGDPDEFQKVQEARRVLNT